MACAAAGTISATPIPVGYLSFAPDAPFAGQTSISLVNASGAFGCSVDAPVCTEIAIEGTLSLDYGAADIINTSTPVTVNIAAQNVALSAAVKLRVTSETAADQLIDCNALTGTVASSTTTGKATFPFSVSISNLRATW